MQLDQADQLMKERFEDFILQGDLREMAKNRVHVVLLSTKGLYAFHKEAHADDENAGMAQSSNLLDIVAVEMPDGSNYHSLTEHLTIYSFRSAAHVKKLKLERGIKEKHVKLQGDGFNYLRHRVYKCGNNMEAHQVGVRMDGAADVCVWNCGGRGRECV